MATPPDIKTGWVWRQNVVYGNIPITFSVTWNTFSYGLDMGRMTYASIWSDLSFEMPGTHENNDYLVVSGVIAQQGFVSQRLYDPAIIGVGQKVQVSEHKLFTTLIPGYSTSFPTKTIKIPGEFQFPANYHLFIIFQGTKVTTLNNFPILMTWKQKD